MKHHFKLIVCVALLLAVTAPPAFAQSKVGVVDLRILFEGYFKTKQADAKIKERAAELDQEREDMLKGLKVDEQAYRQAEEMAKDLSVSPAEAEKRKSEAAGLLTGLQEKQKNIQSWKASAQEIISEQQTRMRARVIEDINTEITAIAKQDGLFMVFDLDAMGINQTKVIPYHNGENDITKKVLENLNAGAPAGLVEPTK